MIAVNAMTIISKISWRKLILVRDDDFGKKLAEKSMVGGEQM